VPAPTDPYFINELAAEITLSLSVDDASADADCSRRHRLPVDSSGGLEVGDDFVAMVELSCRRGSHPVPVPVADGHHRSSTVVGTFMEQISKHIEHPN